MALAEWAFSYKSTCSLQCYFMVFTASQAAVFHSASCWMEEWPWDILSAQSLNVVMLVPSDLPRAVRDFENEKCVSETSERSAECDISIVLCSIACKEKSAAEWGFSSVRIFK